MKNPQAIAELLEKTFNTIHQVQMQGIPILNTAISVQAVGFQEYEDRIIGVIITPWLMNLVMLAGEKDDWSHLEMGKKQLHEFSSKTYKFMVNEIDGFGKCQTHSIFSPMQDFASHEQAVRAAQDFLDNLMVESELTEEDLVDEDLLGRIMRGEETSEVDLDDFAVIEATETTARPVRGQSEMKVRVEKKNLSRRDLLRGSFLRNA